MSNMVEAQQFGQDEEAARYAIGVAGARNACAMAAAYALSKPVLEMGEMLSRVVPRKESWRASERRERSGATNLTCVRKRTGQQ